MSVEQTLSAVFPQTGWEFEGVLHTRLTTWLQDLVRWVRQDGVISSAWIQDMFWDLLRPPFAILSDREAWLGAGRPLWEGTELLAEAAYLGVWHYLWMHSIHFPEGLKRVLQPVLAQDLWTELSVVVSALPMILDPLTTIPKDMPLFWATMSYMPQLERTAPEALIAPEPEPAMTPDSPEAPLSEDTYTEEPAEWAAGWPVMLSDSQDGLLSEPGWSDSASTDLGETPMQFEMPMEPEVPVVADSPMEICEPAPLPMLVPLAPSDTSDAEMELQSVNAITDMSVSSTPSIEPCHVPRIYVESRLVTVIRHSDIAIVKAATIGMFQAPEAMIETIESHMHLLPAKAREYDWRALLIPGHRDFGARLSLHAPLFSALHSEEAAFAMTVRRRLFRNPRLWNPSDRADYADRTDMLRCVLMPVQSRFPAITVQDVLAAMHCYSRWWLRVDEIQSLFMGRMSQTALKQVMNALIFYGWAQRRCGGNSCYAYGYAASPDARALLTGNPASSFRATEVDWREFVVARNATAYMRQRKIVDVKHGEAKASEVVFLAT